MVVETEEDAAGASTDISTPKEVVVNGTLSSAEDITVNADIKLEPSNQNNQVQWHAVLCTLLYEF